MKTAWLRQFGPLLLACATAIAAGCGGETCESNSCSGHGTCNDSSGTATCTCAAGYTGASCSACADGYQDNDSNGECKPNCASAALQCGSHGTCSDANGTAACSCESGWGGALCADCAGGYHFENGVCVVDTYCLPTTCSGHGTCDDSAGQPVCTCEEGYALPSCGTCSDGYQDNDTNGTCLPTCAHVELTCGSHGTCSDASGTAACVCQQPYSGATCTDCMDGFQDNDHNGTCLESCATAGLACTNGVCNDATGTAACNCNNGFQDNDHNGTCQPTCASAALSCGSHGACSDTSGTAACACSTGYTGADCASCASGYASDGNGGCTQQGGGTGETCANAISLPLVTGTVQGNTTGSGDDYHPSCVSSDASERVYTFQVSGAAHVAFETSGFDTVLYLRSSCTGTDIACNDDGGSVSRGSRIEGDLTSGTYFLFVDGYEDEGAYQLTVTVTNNCSAGMVPDGQGGCTDDPCDPSPCNGANTHCTVALPGYTCDCNAGYIADPNAAGSCMVDPNPHGESCNDPLVISGDGSATGSTTNAANDATGSCGGNGADRVYAFHAASQTRYQFATSGFDTVLYVRSSCTGSSSEVACNDDAGGGNGSALTGTVNAGDYYVFVDSYSSGGNYTFNYSLRTDPCAGDPCPGTPECQASADWSSYTCVCPTGTVPYNGSCIDDPCDPNPCNQVPDKTLCVADLPGNYHCSCRLGYIDNGSGGCMMDPNANDWTFFVFLNGDNNLESDAHTDMGEMGAAGSNVYVHIVALQDFNGTNDSSEVLVTQGGTQVLQDLGEADMSSWQTLRDFGVWAVNTYPSRHYAMVMWDHGDGWKAGPKPHAPLKAFSNDEHSSNYDTGIQISNGDYARALQAISSAAGGKLDIVGFDACLMGMYEVAKASAPYAHYLVGSEETEPGSGWAYDGFLPGLATNHTQSAETLGRAIVDAYYGSTTDASTLSLTNLDTISALDTAISNFATQLRANTSLYSSINSVRNSTQAFYVTDHLDLWDFASRISQMSGAPQALRDSATALIAQLGQSIVYSRAQSSYSGAHGLAIYLPSSSDTFDTDYVGAGATWSTATTWDEFLQSFAR